jgi:hypothetical protein
VAQKSSEDHSKRLDKKISPKKGVTRIHIHQYDLRLKEKQSKTEDEAFGALWQALQKFLDISLQADPSSTVPPFFEQDCNDKTVPDVNSKYQFSDLDSMALLRQRQCVLQSYSCTKHFFSGVY